MVKSGKLSEWLHLQQDEPGLTFLPEAENNTQHEALISYQLHWEAGEATDQSPLT